MFKNNNFIERSLVSVLSFLKGAIFADEYACRAAFLQLLDPRVKAVSFFLFIVQILFTKSIVILLCFYALCLLLVWVSKINLWFFLKRTWVFIPLFSLFIAIPALFSVFTPGKELVTFSIIGLRLTITQQGLSSVGFFIARVITSVSFVILLSITTRHFALLKVLRIFKIPQVFVMTLGMCYRYIYLFVEMIENIYLAIKSRVGINVQYKKGQHIVAWNIAYLWQRSYQLNENVYYAMFSRGYTGEPYIINDFRVRAKDLVYLFAALGVFIAGFYLNNLIKI